MAEVAVVLVAALVVLVVVPVGVEVLEVGGKPGARVQSSSLAARLSIPARLTALCESARSSFGHRARFTDSQGTLQENSKLYV